MNKLMRAVSRLVLSAAMLSAVCLSAYPAAIPAYAETATVTSAMKAGAQTIDIRSTTVITDNTNIPAGTTIYVRSGGILYINPGVSYTLSGNLKVAAGGSVYVRGTLDAKKNSLISVSGKMKLLSTGTINLAGKMSVNVTGTVKGAGTLAVLNKFSDITCKGTVTAKISAPAPVEKNGVTTVGGVIIVNKTYHLPDTYGEGLSRATYSAYLKMKKASGFDMSIMSGFRSYDYQKEVFAYWAGIDGYDVAVTYSALPGQSEHQTGLAMDISSLKQSFGQTDEGKWLAANCYKYGFIIRYPQSKTDITGYMYEPWHVRYLGTSTAKLVYDSGLCLEEFLGVSYE